MGTAPSSPSHFSNEEVIRTEMTGYAKKWQHQGQTKIFREKVPTDVVDFTDEYKRIGLDKVFTSGKLHTKIVFGNHNCLHLYRDSHGETMMPVFSNEEHTVLHVLGEPGRDLGNSCGSKVSHMMVVKHSNNGIHDPITFNEMLPSNQAEVNDLERRIAIGKKAYDNLRRNVPLSECGEKVKAKASKMGASHDMGIREFLGRMITSLTPEFKSETPGYKLMDNKDNEVSSVPDSVQSLINTTFTNQSLDTRVCIQPPSKNSQALSHIHLFMVKDLPEELNNNYYDCEVILKIKKDLLQEMGLTMKSVRPATSLPAARPVTPEKKGSNSPMDGGATLSRQASYRRATTPPRAEDSSLTRQSTAARATTPPRAEDSSLTRQSTAARATTPPRDEKAMFSRQASMAR
jgi:hypothetical protein